MNSLNDLNNESQRGLQYDDDRSFSFTVSNQSPSTQIKTIYPGDIFELPVATNITSIRNASNLFVGSEGIQYKVTLYETGNLALVSNVDHYAANVASRITFAGIPLNNSGRTYLTDVGTGDMYVTWSFNNSPAYTNILYTVNGIKSVSDWNLIKDPLIDYDIVSNSSNIFHSEIKTTNSSFDKSWYTTVNPIYPHELTTPSDFFWISESISETEMNPVAVSSEPAVSQSSNVSLRPSSYTLTITGTDSAAFGNLHSYSALGGTSTWSSTNNSLVITGNASQMNSHLASLTYTPAQNYDGSFGVHYNLFNPVTNHTSSVTQYFKSVSDYSTYFSEPLTEYFDDNSENILIGAPVIAGGFFNGRTVTISTDTPSSLYKLTSQGTGGTSTWNGTAKTLTISGSRDEVNSHLASIKFEVVIGFKQTMHLTYALTDGPSQVQTLMYRNVSDAVENVAVSRDFIANTTNQNLFKSYFPQITETAAGSPTYTFTVYSSAGYIGYSDTDLGITYGTGSVTPAPFVISGSKEYVNEQIYNLNFYPLKDVSGSQTLSIQILRDATTIADQVVQFTGTVNELSLTPSVYKITSSQTFTPTFEQSQYMSCDIMLVGAGGGGGRVSAGRAGAGGAGAVVAARDIFIPWAPLTVTIGTAGSGATINNANGTNGTSTQITESLHNLITMTAIGGEGGGGGSSPYTTTRAGGNYNSSESNSSGNSTTGGTWWHKGGAGALYGGGGGGAKTAGLDGSPSSVTGYGGDGLHASDFDLVGYTGATTESSYIAFGGTSGADVARDGYRYGAGGDSAATSTNGRNGSAGVIVIRFY